MRFIVMFVTAVCVLFLTSNYLMKPNMGETAVHDCHCRGDMTVRLRKVLARPWVGV